MNEREYRDRAMRGEEGKNYSMLIVFFLLALLVRWVAIEQTPVVARDGMKYIHVAKFYSIGAYAEGFGAFSRSLYPFLIVPFQKAFGDWVTAGQWVSAFCGALTVIPLYILAKGIFDRRVALWTAIFYSTCPDLVKYSAEVLRDVPFILFYTTSLCLGYIGIKERRAAFMGLAGLFTPLSASIRTEGWILLAVLTVFLFWHRFKNNIPWRKALAIFSVFLAGCIFVLAFFGLILVQKGINITEGMISKGDKVLLGTDHKMINNLEKEIEEKGISQKEGSFLYLAKKHRFVLYLFHILYKTVKAFNILFLLFLLGLIKRRQIGYHQDEFLLFAIYVVSVTVFLLYLNFSNYLSTRHPLYLVVTSLIWSGVGFVELKERAILWIKERDFALRHCAVRWVTPVLLLVICIPLLSMAWAPNRKDKLELKEIGLWLNHNGYAHSVIIGQHEFARLAFYADGEFIHLPKGSYEDIIKFAKANEASLLVVNGKTIDHLSANFLKLVSPIDLQRIQIPGIKTPKYATLVFRVKEWRGKE